MKLILCRFEWKIEDFWIGAFWRTTRGVQADGSQRWMFIDVWVCVVPCVPLHVTIQNDRFDCGVVR